MGTVRILPPCSLRIINGDKKGWSKKGSENSLLTILLGGDSLPEGMRERRAGLKRIMSEAHSPNDSCHEKGDIMHHQT